jgi:hypothetical protein
MAESRARWPEAYFDGMAALIALRLKTSVMGMHWTSHRARYELNCLCAWLPGSSVQ